MNAILAIARRELASQFLTPAGYVISALFLFFTALVFFAVAPALVGGGFAPGQPASMRVFFQVGTWIFFLIGPAISMRAFSDEIRIGSIEVLMSAPVHESQLVLGKFLGAFAFLVVMLVPTVLFAVALETFGRPDYGTLLCGYLGLLLVGAAYLASGILASSLTSSQVLAYIATVFFWLILVIATMVLPVFAGALESLAEQAGTDTVLAGVIDWSRGAARFLAAGSPIARMGGFINGFIDTFNVAYFASLTVIFLVASTRAIAMRRWA